VFFIWTDFVAYLTNLFANLRIFFAFFSCKVDYPSLRSVFHIEKTNYYYFSKNEFVFKFGNYIIFHHLL
jgi:hypothetical protein